MKKIRPTCHMLVALEGSRLADKPCGAEMVNTGRRTSRRKLPVFACPRCDVQPGGVATWQT